MSYKEMKRPVHHADSEEKYTGFLQFALDLVERPHLLLPKTACYLISGAVDVTL